MQSRPSMRFGRYVYLPLMGLAMACGSSLERPPSMAAPRGSFLEVPYPPPPGKVELVPEQPKGSRWVDGEWTWEANRWRWQEGGWFEVPPGIFYSRGQTKRPGDTRLLYANPTWRDKNGAPVPPPPLVAAADAEQFASRLGLDKNGEPQDKAKPQEQQGPQGQKKEQP